jgi:photosystem II stability/assembly factor-like uncharacterized protein
MVLAGLLCVRLLVPAAVHTFQSGRLDFSRTGTEALHYRLIGPHKGSRVTAVAGVAGEMLTFYMGAAGGGVWKTTDAGETWANVSDGFFDTGSIGAIAVSESAPSVVYVGTGSACIRGNVSTGVGMYKSTDSGKTWRFAGLKDAGQIGAIVVHPANPDLVFAAALGHPFGANADRGVFRSRDGGTSWQKVLFVSDRTGAADLVMAPTNPDVLYASMWTAERKPWTIISGGREGGLFKSQDGGTTWTKLVGGLPSGLIGRTGIAVSPADPRRIWAIVEADGGGLYRSDDAGEHFRLINAAWTLRTRPWYYMHVYADPGDPNTVYVLNTNLYKSTDGGTTFHAIPMPHGDNHAMWINPRHPEIFIEGNDGGATVTLSGGQSWSTQLNQPTAELYRVSVDNQFPYRLYGSQQDTYEVLSVPSRTANYGARLQLQHWYGVGGMEGGDAAPDPTNANIIYSGGTDGEIYRFDRMTGQIRPIKPYPEIGAMPASHLKYRFQRTAPIRVSPHDPRVVYQTSNHVHRTTDGGQHWEVISPDLTTNDPERTSTWGGPITREVTSEEVYCTIFAFEESPAKAGVLWAGSDDGRVHVSQDSGAEWRDVTPPQMPKWGTVNAIEPSAHDPARAIVAVLRYRLDDYAPYVFRTNDAGRTWTPLTDGKNGIPSNHPVRIVREDPDRKGLLYAGTEFGMYVSFDDGARWQSMQLNLPVVPVTDIKIHSQDLVLSTQGRSFWILDDLTPLHQWRDSAAAEGMTLFKPRDAYRVRSSGEELEDAYVGGINEVSNPRDIYGGARIGRDRLGEEPADGVTVNAYFNQVPSDEVTLAILDASGATVRRYSSRQGRAESHDALVVRPGLNRFVWDMRHADFIGRRGPLGAPGPYQVTLTAGRWNASQSFTLRPDPRVATSAADFQEQFGLLSLLRDRMVKIDALIKRLQAVGPDRPAALRQLEFRLVDADDDKRQGPQDAPPPLMAEYAHLFAHVAGADARPTDGAKTLFQDLEKAFSTLSIEADRLLPEAGKGERRPGGGRR